jgi:hypothetical protein
MQRIYWLTEDLLPSQEWLCFMELVSYVVSDNFRTFEFVSFFTVVVARESQQRQSAGLAYWSDSARLLSRARILISWLAVTWSVQEEAFIVAVKTSSIPDGVVRRPGRVHIDGYRDLHASRIFNNNDLQQCWILIPEVRASGSGHDVFQLPFRKTWISVSQLVTEPRDVVKQRFSNFFQVGTTFISQNVLRTTLLLSPLKANLSFFFKW